MQAGTHNEGESEASGGAGDEINLVGRHCASRDWIARVDVRWQLAVFERLGLGLTTTNRGAQIRSL